VTSFGCFWDVRQTTKNLHALLEDVGRTDIPVHVGSRWPFGSNKPPTDDGQIVHGDQGIAGLVAPIDKADACEADVNMSTTTLSGAEVIVNLARGSPGEITIVSFSALTNVALALALEPRLPSLVKGLIVMGGTFDHPGNTSPLSEANFNHDAAAAAAVCSAWGTKAPSPFVLAPLDVTHGAMVGPDLMEAISEAGGEAVRLFAQPWSEYADAYCRLGGVCDGAPLHDAHPIAYMLQPENYVVETIDFSIMVGGSENGMCVIDRRSRSSGKEPPHGTCTGRVMMQVNDAPLFGRQLVDAAGKLASEANARI